MPFFIKPFDTNKALCNGCHTKTSKPKKKGLAFERKKCLAEKQDITKRIQKKRKEKDWGIGENERQQKKNLQGWILRSRATLWSMMHSSAIPLKSGRPMTRSPWRENAIKGMFKCTLLPWPLPKLIQKRKKIVLSDPVRQRRRQWQPTPVLLPGKSHGWRSLIGCSPWGP